VLKLFESVEYNANEGYRFALKYIHENYIHETKEIKLIEFFKKIRERPMTV